MSLGPGLFVVAAVLMLAASVLAFVNGDGPIWFGVGALICAGGFVLATLQEIRREKRRRSDATVDDPPGGS